MTETPGEKKFMREKIVKPKMSRREAAGRIFCYFLLAVIFGVVAAVSFVVSRPMAEKYFGTEPPSSSEPITIEKDDEPGATTAAMETMEPTAPETRPETDPEEIREIVKEELEQIPWTPENIGALNTAISKVGSSADLSIVTVSSVKHQTDWFDNPIESTGQYAGVILAVNSCEVVILTCGPAVKNADSLQVTFEEGMTASGELKQTDSAADLAVISVKTQSLEESTKKRIRAIELGNSYSVRSGDLIVAVGSPAGRVHSVKHGSVTYVAKGVQTVDGQTRVICTDVLCNEEKGSFFLNLSGQLIGWATTIFDSEGMENETIIMPISEYKGNLQKLSNGVSIPYMGIKGQETSKSMQEEGVPAGVYITESIVDGPAYLAGIQNGDILVKIQGQDIDSIHSFQGCLENMESGSEVSVVIERRGIDAYKEIEYRVIIGAR